MTNRTPVKFLLLINLLSKVVNVFTQQVCIIGAGYSGLATARHMEDYGLNYTVFEATRYIGGTWRFDPNVGTDEDGLPVFTSQYKNLRVNVPYQTMEYSGFPFPKGTPSYPSGVCFYKYLKSFAKHFDLLKNIQFQSLVTKVHWAGDRFHVTYMNSSTRENVTKECDFVVVATGESMIPNIPYMEGQEVFKGKLMHSHDYKDAEDYRDKSVLLIGAGPSGLDLARQLTNVSSKVIHSHHLVYNEPIFGDNYIKKPDLSHFTPNGAMFQDSSMEYFDIVILCTGYNYFHPFLNHKSSGITATSKYVMPLYQYIVNINYHTMTFIGSIKFTMTRLLDAQAEYSAALAAGQFKLPSQEDMFHIWLNHLDTIRKKNKNITDLNIMELQDMNKYLYALHKEAGISLIPPVLATITNINRLHFLEDFLNLNDYEYTIVSDTKYTRTYNPNNRLCLIDEN